jgi:hypothetical protein
MKRFVLALAGAAGLLLAANGANADDWGGRRHARYHNELDRREFDRYLIHRDAHRYPMTWRGHERLHDALDYDRYLDYREHRAYHRGYYGRPLYYYGGRCYPRGGFSIQFGF